jgi:rhodanese-related sulfurtransferase
MSIAKHVWVSTSRHGIKARQHAKVTVAVEDTAGNRNAIAASVLKDLRR